MTDSRNLSLIRRCHYNASFGGVELGPMTAFPLFHIEGRTVEATLCRETAETPAETALLVSRKAILTLTLGDISAALELAAGPVIGDDLYAPERRKVLDIIPATGDPAAKIWRFPAACLLAGVSYRPESGRDHGVEVQFAAFPGPGGELYQLVSR